MGRRCLYTICIAAAALPCAVGIEKVRLGSIGVQTFHANAWCKTGKAAQGGVAMGLVPQLQCAGEFCSRYESRIASVQCENKGTDSEGHVNWKCTGSMPKGCKFGRTTISCEAYKGDSDGDFIHPGSCGLQYSLDCSRLDAAGFEEQNLRAKVAATRGQQQELTQRRLNEIANQAERDKCGLGVAGALHEVGDKVEYSRTKAFDYSAEIGNVADIWCDPSDYSRAAYTFKGADGRSVHHVREEELRTWVAPIYKDESLGRFSARYVTLTDEDYLSARCGPMTAEGRRCSGHGICPVSPRGRPAEGGRCQCDSVEVAEGQMKPFSGDFCEKRPSRDPTAIEMVVGAVVAAVVGLFACLFGGGEKNRPATGTQAHAAGGVPRPQHRELDRDAMATKREALDAIKRKKAELRVKKVEAKQHVERLAALDRFQTEMDQLQRDVENDTAMLGNVMSRVDHVLDEYEATSFATTQMR